MALLRWLWVIALAFAGGLLGAGLGREAADTMFPESQKDTMIGRAHRANGDALVVFGLVTGSLALPLVADLAAAALKRALGQLLVADEEPTLMTGSHEVIYVAASNELAFMVKNALIAEGVNAYVRNQFHCKSEGDLVALAPTGPQVLVENEDAPLALELVSKFDQAIRSGDVDEELSQLEDAADDTARDWPACPSCSRPRLTSCPVCETAASSFPKAFMPGGRRKRLIVICPTCDEVFRPRFLARCEWCGYQFGDGVELSAAAEWTSPFAEMNARAWIVLFGLILSFALLVGLVVSAGPKP
jgi:hypothetical protein